ncbi:MAG TPA: J domain-containing protein [Candidatus Binataceae bacterium]|nr:J domain-containing protein [Candidatus Binataceae bacterium]
MLALAGDDAGLAEMKKVVASIPELDPWITAVEQHLQDRWLFPAIEQAVAANPRCLQTDIKQLIGATDGAHIANLISYLEKGGKIVRIKEGQNYRLVLAGSNEAPVRVPKRLVSSHRTDSKAPPLYKIDVSSLRYVPLPRAPMRWEEAQSSRERGKTPDANDLFDLRDSDWRVTSVDKMPSADRPDSAFRRMYSVDSGLLMIDDLGRAEGFGPIEAAAIRYDRSGRLVAKAGFSHKLFHLGVHTLGHGIIAMSSDCVVHAYDDGLQPLFETALIEAPEIQALRNRFDIPQVELFKHLCCVALSRDNGRYLFTAVDEAWCIGSKGIGLWGVKLPMEEGWKRISTPSTKIATSVEIQSALSLMGLSLPVTPEDLKGRYRELAMKLHPDHNPSDPSADDRMKALNAAAEVLTGIDRSALPAYTGATFVKELDRKELTIHGLKFALTFSYQQSELYASDRIYAASFAARSDSVYLAGRTGRIVLVNEKGEGVRVYDLGAVPSKIMDTGEYLYILTDTRVYVLRDDSLCALVDMFNSGNLLIADSGFGLLESKRFRWFRKNGVYLGSIVSKDPIRRVYWSPGGMVVETRQRRATIDGVPPWWD